MSASLISPSGKVLIRRARCTLQTGAAPLDTPVRITPELGMPQSALPGLAARPPLAPGANPHDPAHPAHPTPADDQSGAGKGEQVHLAR